MTLTVRLGILLGFLTWSLTSAQPPAPARTVKQCLTLDETTLRNDLNQVTREFFSEELNAVDLPRMVQDKWLELGLPEVLGSEVDKAVQVMRMDTGLTQRLTSSILPLQATELAKQIANRTFTSETFRSRLASLADEVADFTGGFSVVAARSTSSATACVQNYLSGAYGREDLPALSAELPRGVADEATQWQRFTQNFKDVLKLAERSAAFRRELSGVPKIDLDKLAEVVRLVPEKVMLQAAQDGQLRRIVGLPEAALEMLQTVPSPTTVLAWADLAGTRLNDVVKTKIYRHKMPEDFSPRTLTRLLDTGNVVTIAKVSALPKGEMETLLQLPTAHLNALTSEFGSSQLQTVLWYAGALAQEPFNALVARLIERPPRLEKFSPEAVRNAVVNSREPLSAVTFLSSEPEFGFLAADFIGGLGRDLATVFSGTVSSRLLPAKYDLGSLLLLLVIVVFTFSIVRIVVLLAALSCKRA